jgi:adenine-specific DNA-methyltransferase
MPPKRRTSVPQKKSTNGPTGAKSYRHPSASVLLRPDVGTQAQFKKKKPPATYRYDSSLSPTLDWDGQNPSREHGEAILKQIIEAATLDQAKAAAHKLKAMSRPFLDWAGKAERLSFDVPTLPLFVHERLSTKAIIETLHGHKRDQHEQFSLFDLFGDPEHSVTDQVLRAYEHQDQWVNRMVLGDSLAVMNSLLQYESLGGQVQMIYMDPPYGVSFGSNFQPFVRKRDVAHNDDEDMTREPEMVQAYRDTWELGLHSYLTYLRDRLLLCRELLHPSGSIFVQISDKNIHHVRELLDEVFGDANRVGMIAYRTSSPLGASGLPSVCDFLLWYARDADSAKFRQLFERKDIGEGTEYTWVEESSGNRRKMTSEEKARPGLLPQGSKVFARGALYSSGYTPTCIYDFEFEGHRYSTQTKSWRTNRQGMDALIEKRRLIRIGELPYYVQYHSDFPLQPINNLWTDTRAALGKTYVVETSFSVVQRCLLMTTDPGDLVLDPTCGSGTTALMAEQWGRRWITADVSRVPLALARQRILTATFPWFELQDNLRGPAGGFIYSRKQNTKGEDVGGLVPHLQLQNIARDEPCKEEVLVDRPEVKSGVTRVSGPFVFEATIPTPVDWDRDGQEDSSPKAVEDYANFSERMLDVLRRSPVLRLQGNKSVTFKNIRPPAKTLSLSAEALVENGEEKPVAFVFGPENGAVSQKLVFDAAKEANAKSYTHLYVIGFGIQPNARELVENCAEVGGIPATYVEATRDLHMGDLLKNMRSSQIFSVCGLPEVKLRKLKEGKYQVDLLGLDVLDPVTMEIDSRGGDDVPAWFLDTNYNDLSFHVGQAFFPRTSAWENLKKALKTDYEETVWDHLAGTKSAPFEAGDQAQIAVKVIDDRGNELMVVKKLSEAGK